ncbi:hypothetical protein B0H13DRAFT_2502089 [Mycena leptocephala]|nr:hypothetical protein B0H13DRAFT_2502089 [Mycena leptocephala]
MFLTRTSFSAQRMNRKVLQKWRWPALCLAFVLLFSFYLFRLKLTTTADAHCGAPVHLRGTTRLARTLQENEKRYQYTLVQRGKIIQKSGGMQINAFPPRNQLANLLWDFFIPAFSCPFPMDRVGTLADGGKWVCGLDRVFYHRPNPIIYSLNEQTSSHSSFEQDVIKRSPGVQIYGFDANATHEVASKWPWGKIDVPADQRSRVQFNHFALSDSTANKSFSLQTVMRGFGHVWIDILKVELRGSGFATFLAIIEENQGEPLPFGQLLIKVHVGLSGDMMKVAHFSSWFTRLECAGLRPYYFEVSMMDVNNRRAEPSLVYWSFINLKGTHALVDDDLAEYP